MQLEFWFGAAVHLVWCSSALGSVFEIFGSLQLRIWFVQLDSCLVAAVNLEACLNCFSAAWQLLGCSMTVWV
jgi:hypothetical protein